jgi:hypothetical protein
VAGPTGRNKGGVKQGDGERREVVHTKNGTGGRANGLATNRTCHRAKHVEAGRLRTRKGRAPIEVQTLPICTYVRLPIVYALYSGVEKTLYRHFKQDHQWVEPPFAVIAAWIRSSIKATRESSLSARVLF